MQHVFLQCSSILDYKHVTLTFPTIRKNQNHILINDVMDVENNCMDPILILDRDKESSCTHHCITIITQTTNMPGVPLNNYRNYVETLLLATTFKYHIIKKNR